MMGWMQFRSYKIFQPFFVRFWFLSKCELWVSIQTVLFMGCVVKMTLLPGEFHCSNVHANCLDWALQLMNVCNQLLITISSSVVVLAWYGCWTIKAVVEAEVLYGGCTVSRGCIAEGENALLTLVVYIYIICGYQTSRHP
jgi:hypothetical protein